MEVGNREAIPEMRRQRQSRRLRPRVATVRDVERVYQREWRAAWKILWPIIEDGFKAEAARERGEVKLDNESRPWDLLQAAIRRALQAIQFTYLPDAGGLAAVGGQLFGETLEKAKRTVRAVNRRDVKNAARMLAIDKLGAQRRGVVRSWVADGVSLIRTIPQRELGAMHRIVTQESTKGTRVETLAKKLRGRFGYGKRHARLVARDQTAKLNEKVSRNAMQTAGATRYRWVSSLDSRVRKEHRVLHNTVQSWNDPPPAGPKGEPGHPGQWYQCRCVALPVFDDEDDRGPVTSQRASAQGFGPDQAG